MITYELHFIRHGMTEGNLSGRYVGRQDPPVCPEGFAQMEKMVKSYRYPQVDTVYTSPMLRCRQTVDFLYPGVPVTAVEDIAEMSFGSFEGCLISEVRQLPEFKLWISDSRRYAPPGGENGEDFHSRISAGLNAIFMDMMKNKITKAAVVTHGGVLMTLFSVFAMPRLPMTSWTTDNLTGYTARTSTQMWMRDGFFEAGESLPLGYQARTSSAVANTFGLSNEEE